nr:metallophosphoesterase [Prevotella sp.]
MDRILIIPDVHGRHFWRKAIEENEAEKIIFLGDYMDPYPSDNISTKDAFDNFKDIIDFAMSHRKMVVLLYGNHDLHYISKTFLKYAGASNYDKEWAHEIRNMFLEHKKLFQLSWEAVSNNNRILFSHAGISSVWYRVNKSIIGDLTVKNLNNLLSSEEGIETLCQVGISNGGYSPSGSMVWADVDEMINFKNIPGVYQVFGHSLLDGQPVIMNTFACLDCMRPFLLKCD